MTLEEQKRFQLFAAIELAAFIRAFIDGDGVLLVLLLVENEARPIFIEIVLRESAKVRQIVAVAALMQNLTEENDVLELLT